MHLVRMAVSSAAGLMAVAVVVGGNDSEMGTGILTLSTTAFVFVGLMSSHRTPWHYIGTGGRCALRLCRRLVMVEQCRGRRRESRGDIELYGHCGGGRVAVRPAGPCGSVGNNTRLHRTDVWVSLAITEFDALLVGLRHDYSGIGVAQLPPGSSLVDRVVLISVDAIPVVVVAEGFDLCRVCATSHSRPRSRSTCTTLANGSEMTLPHRRPASMDAMMVKVS